MKKVMMISVVCLFAVSGAKAMYRGANLSEEVRSANISKCDQNGQALFKDLHARLESVNADFALLSSRLQALEAIRTVPATHQLNIVPAIQPRVCLLKTYPRASRVLFTFGGALLAGFGSFRWLRDTRIAAGMSLLGGAAGYLSARFITRKPVDIK